MSKTSRFEPGSSQDPVLYELGGVYDYEDDSVESGMGGHIHVYNPYLEDPAARLDTFDDEGEVLGPSLDIDEFDRWVEEFDKY